MDIFQIFNEAGNAFNRVVQKAEEQILNAERTHFDEVYQERVMKLETLISFTEKIIEETQVMLEPNPAYRVEGKVMEKLDKKAERATPLESLGSAFESAARAIREYCPTLMEDFILCGKYQTKLGIASKGFASRANEVYVLKLKKLLELDLHRYKVQSDLLESLRLDHDSLKIRVKKAITVVGKENLEKEFEIVKEKFAKQMEVSYEFFKDIDKFFNVHKKLLNEFVEAQSAYYMGCHKELEKFQAKLKSSQLSMDSTSLEDSTPVENGTADETKEDEEKTEETPEDPPAEE